VPRFLWPGFQFAAPAVSSTTTAAPVSTDPWTKLTLFAEVWGHSKNTQLFPRFERVFPSLTPITATATLGSLISLTYEVQTQFPFVIATDSKVLISSSVTPVA
jgi:hypothetical protein